MLGARGASSARRAHLLVAGAEAVVQRLFIMKQVHGRRQHVRHVLREGLPRQHGLGERVRLRSKCCGAGGARRRAHAAASVGRGAPLRNTSVRSLCRRVSLSIFGAFSLCNDVRRQCSASSATSSLKLASLGFFFWPTSIGSCRSRSTSHSCPKSCIAFAAIMSRSAAAASSSESASSSGSLGAHSGWLQHGSAHAAKPTAWLVDWVRSRSIGILRFGCVGRGGGAERRRRRPMGGASAFCSVGPPLARKLACHEQVCDPYWSYRSRSAPEGRGERFLQRRSTTRSHATSKSVTHIAYWSCRSRSAPVYVNPPL